MEDDRVGSSGSKEAENQRKERRKRGVALHRSGRKEKEHELARMVPLVLKLFPVSSNTTAEDIINFLSPVEILGMYT